MTDIDAVDLDTLSIGDDIRVELADGQTYVITVSDIPAATNHEVRIQGRLKKGDRFVRIQALSEVAEGAYDEIRLDALAIESNDLSANERLGVVVRLETTANHPNR